MRCPGVKQCKANGPMHGRGNLLQQATNVVTNNAGAHSTITPHLASTRRWQKASFVCKRSPTKCYKVHDIRHTLSFPLCQGAYTLRRLLAWHSGSGQLPSRFLSLKRMFALPHLLQTPRSGPGGGGAGGSVGLCRPDSKKAAPSPRNRHRDHGGTGGGGGSGGKRAAKRFATAVAERSCTRACSDGTVGAEARKPGG